MTYTVDKKILGFLWDTLSNKESHLSRPMVQERLAEKISKNGWTTSDDLEELISSIDTRLTDYRFNPKQFSKILGCHWETVFSIPKTKSRDVIGYEALSSSNVAWFLIVIEQLGFQINPTLIVGKFLPSIKPIDKAFLTESELEVFWYEKMRHKKESIRLFVDEWQRDDWAIKKLKTAHGYKIETRFNKENEPICITISAPKYRKQPKTILTRCKDCGYQWQKGNPEASYSHRREHLRRMAYLNPQLSTKFLSERQNNTEPELVTSISPQWKCKLVYERAVAFKREFNYDSIQWPDPISTLPPDWHGYIFGNSAGAIVGACAFLQRKSGNGLVWSLEWVWICPTERRKGHLSQRWSFFKKRYGDFIVQEPISPAMKAFISKH